MAGDTLDLESEEQKELENAKRRDEVLERMLKTPPKSNKISRLTDQEVEAAVVALKREESSS